MKDSKDLLDSTQKQLQASSPSTQTEAGPKTSDQSATIDAINQIFAEFELVYHNQYNKAYPTLEKLQYAKKLWYSNLRTYSPEQIIHAAHKAIKESEFLPTIRGLIKFCDDDLSSFGLLDTRSAYIEACTATSPRTAFNWSHPAVYYAGKEAGWFYLSNNTEAKSFPIFEQCYQRLCKRVQQGEQLQMPNNEALPESPAPSLSTEKQLDKIQAIKQSLSDL